jgi:dipeptidyl aminopeptidase/acylaminoacyl peptidase
MSLGALAAEPPPLEVYGSLPKTEGVKLSPDGTMLAMVTTEGENRFLSITKIGGGTLARSIVGDLKLASFEWVGDDYVAVFVHKTANFGRDWEMVQGATIAVSDGTLRPILHETVGHLAALVGKYGYAKKDGRWFGYFGMQPRSLGRTISARSEIRGFTDLCRIDLETGDITVVEKGSLKRQHWVLDAQGEIVAESEYDPESGNWKVFRPGADDKPVASGHSPFGAGLAGLSRTPGTVLIENGAGEEETVELHLDTGKLESFLPAGQEQGFIRSSATGLLVGVFLPFERRTLMFEPALDKRLKSIEAAFKGHHWKLVSHSDDFNRFIVHVSGSDSAGVWQFVDFKTGKATPVAEDHPDIPDAMIGPVKMFDYRASDGLALQGVLTLPPGRASRSLPLIVLPHGGPEDHDKVEFDWWAQAFAARGYAVLQPNFRGSDGYGTAFRNAGFGEWGRKMETDISDGVAALAAAGMVDSKRVCIVGASYGGYAALAGVTLQHGLYRCAASYGGVTDMQDLIGHPRGYEETGMQSHSEDTTIRYLMSYVGIKSADDPAVRDISPRHQANKADAPILLIYGENDTVVPPKQSKDMATALRWADKTVDLIELDGEDHWMSKSRTRLQMLKATIAFVEKYNPPDGAGSH